MHLDIWAPNQAQDDQDFAVTITVDDGAVVFKDLPRGMDGQLVSLTFAGDSPYIWKANVLMDEAKNLEINFSKADLDQLRTDLKKLD